MKTFLLTFALFSLVFSEKLMRSLRIKSEISSIKKAKLNLDDMLSEENYFNMNQNSNKQNNCMLENGRMELMQINQLEFKDVIPW